MKERCIVLPHFRFSLSLLIHLWFRRDQHNSIRNDMIYNSLLLLWSVLKGSCTNIHALWNIPKASEILQSSTSWNEVLRYYFEAFQFLVCVHEGQRTHRSFRIPECSALLLHRKRRASRGGSLAGSLIRLPEHAATSYHPLVPVAQTPGGPLPMLGSPAPNYSNSPCQRGGIKRQRGLGMESCSLRNPRARSWRVPAAMPLPSFRDILHPMSVPLAGEIELWQFLNGPGLCIFPVAEMLLFWNIFRPVSFGKV